MSPADRYPRGAAPGDGTRAVALVSGGLDSAVMAGLAARAGAEIWPLYVRQGFVWEEEEAASVARFLDALRRRDGAGVGPLRIARSSVPEGLASGWAVDSGQDAPGAETADEAVYLPGRNLALLTQGAILAEGTGASRILLGVLAGNPFADGRPEFFRAFEAAARAALGRRLAVQAPLAWLTKSEVIELGADLPLELTLSCLRPEGGRHCGRCNKCAERRRAFALAGVADRARYAASD